MGCLLVESSVAPDEVVKVHVKQPTTPAPRKEAWQLNLRGAEEEQWLDWPRPASWWTGCEPGAAHGLQPDGTLTSLPLPDVLRATREEVLAYFDNTWALTETLFSCLQGEEAFYRPPAHNLRHPMIFYYAHPAALYVNKLRVSGLLSAPVDAYFETIFETGVDEMSWDDLSKNEMLWPAVSDVTAYRRKVYLLVRDLIRGGMQLPMPSPLDDAHPSWGLFMAIEHERIHIETSSVLIRELPLRLVRKPDAWPAYHPSALGAAPTDEPKPGVHFPAPSLVQVAAGVVVLGKPRSFPSFGWDNEYGSRTLAVGEFEASAAPVTNGEFHAFVRAGGYAHARFWSEEGWRWRAYRNTKCPPFWMADGPQGLHVYRLRLMFDSVTMPWALPVVVNVHEARAYAAWRSEVEGGLAYRLLAEAEHHRLRSDGVGADEVMLHSGAQLAQLGLGNANLASGSECAVDALCSAPGAAHAMGNVWEWCEDTFAALPGFKPHPAYEDFSTPCFDGAHNIIMGGSWVSTGDLASRFARFQFRPHFTQHSGFRIARSPAPPPLSSHDAPPPYAAGWVPPSASGQPQRDPRAADAAAALIRAHGSPAVVLGASLGLGLVDGLGSGARLAALLSSASASAGAAARALVVGAGAGESAFALSESGLFASVLALEHSLPLVSAAERLRDGELRFQRDDGAEVVARPPSADAAARLAFRQVDPSCLPPDLGAFSAVLVDAGVLDSVPSPRGVLSRMGGQRGFVQPGGVLLTASSYSWIERVTPRDAWLSDAPGAESCRDALSAVLGGEFTLERREQLPALSRSSAREFTFRLLEVCVWRRMT